MNSASTGHVTRRNPFRLGTTEAQWVLFQREDGTPKDQIVKNVLAIGIYGKDPSLVTLIVEYQLGERPYADIEHLLTPNPPQIFIYIDRTFDGYLCETGGDEHSSFRVLVRTPTVSEDVLKAAIGKYQKEFCFLAFKNAHEGYPYEYSLHGVSAVAKAGISYTDIVMYLP